MGLCVALSGASLAQQAVTLRITDGPRIENVTSNSAQIAWTTNTPAGSMLLYGVDQNVIQNRSGQGWPTNQIQPSGANPGMAEVPWGGTTHRIQLTNLQPQTTYYFAVRSTAGENTVGAMTSDISSFTTRGGGQAQGQQDQGQYGDRNRERSRPEYRQGQADGERDRRANQSRNYRGQYDNDNERAAYQAGYDEAYGARNDYGYGRPSDSRDRYGRDQNGNADRDENGIRRNDNGMDQPYRNNGGYERGNTNGDRGQYDAQQNPAYQNGFRDGINDGRSDFQSRRSGDPTSTANYRNATGGYDRSWGNQSQYKEVYRQGYMRGYQRGYNGQGSYEPR